MDIIIRNGVIQKTETTKKYNNEEVLKIPWNEYHNNKPGPYYDPENNHLCIFRKPHLIKNFTGPQNPALKKIYNYKYKSYSSYCSICHKEQKYIFDFLKNKPFFMEDNYYVPINENNQITFNVKHNKTILVNLFLKYINKKYNDNKLIIKNLFDINFKKRLNIYSKFYKLLYKILYKPYIYPVSIKESKLLWPWELTPYQKFKLENKNYSYSNIFCNNKKITTNYIIIGN
jgi:hypothetical protein